MADNSSIRLSSRWREEDGASLGEYALVLGVVSVVFVMVLVSFRGSIGNLIARSTTALASSAETGAPSGSASGGTIGGGTTGGGTTSGTTGGGNGGSPGQFGLAPGHGSSSPPGLEGKVPPGKGAGRPSRSQP